MLSMLDSKISRLEKELFLETQYKLPLEVEVYQDLLDSLRQYTTNLYVGDNLAFLKDFALNAPGLVDVCYIDPPYNTGSKFIYNDNRKSNFLGPFGSHSSWMSFMLPRLAAAREMLKSSGIMAISIDDYEYTYLKVLMDRIFGEENFIGNIIVCRSKNGKGSKKNLAPNHEYLLIYGKTQEAILRGQPDETEYDKRDEYGFYRIDGLFRKKGNASLRSDRPNMYYPLFVNPKTGEVSIDPIDGWKQVYPLDSKGVERRWLWGAETARERAYRLYASKNGIVYVKNYAGIKKSDKRTKVRTLWTDTKFYTERATNELTKLFGQKVFDTPKPLEYVKKILDTCAGPDAIVLDFFAGSGTTAHAVEVLNRADNGSRKCILMELDSEIPKDHTAYKAGYRQVSGITEKRLKLINEINPEFRFKVTHQQSKTSSSTEFSGRLNNASSSKIPTNLYYSVSGELKN